MSRDVTVCIPTIGGRDALLQRALTSVIEQTEPARNVKIAVERDHVGQGAAATRNAAWRRATTTWVAFLDDDDELLPHHLEHLLDVAEWEGADLVYPWHRIVGPYGETKPDLLGGQGDPFNPARLDECNFIPVTVLVRREVLEAVGGFPQPGTPEWPHQDCEDWGCWLRLRDAGAKFVHTPTVTWRWFHHGRNTSGRADAARAQMQGAH